MTEPSCPPLIAPRWPAAWSVPSGLSVACTSVATPVTLAKPFGGFNLATHVGDDQERVHANRVSLKRALGVQTIQWLDQVHGVGVIQADTETARASERSSPTADAAWTRAPATALAVLSADCLPIVLVEPRGQRLAVLHGGWRGLVSGVVKATLAALAAADDPPGPGWVAWVGPGITRPHYEIGAEVAAAVRACRLSAIQDDAALGLFPGTGTGKYQLDLVQLACWLLRQEGICRVVRSDLCSYSDARFYSHRRIRAQGGAVTGRMATLVWRTGEG